MWTIIVCSFISLVIGCVIGWQAKSEDNSFDNIQSGSIDIGDNSFISLNTVVRTFQTNDTPTVADLVEVREVLTSEAQL